MLHWGRDGGAAKMVHAALIGSLLLCGRSKRHLGRTYGLAVLLSGSLGRLKPGSCYLKKDFALSLGVGSPSPTETFLRILVIFPS